MQTVYPCSVDLRLLRPAVPNAPEGVRGDAVRKGWICMAPVDVRTCECGQPASRPPGWSSRINARCPSCSRPLDFRCGVVQCEAHTAPVVAEVHNAMAGILGSTVRPDAVELYRAAQEATGVESLRVLAALLTTQAYDTLKDPSVARSGKMRAVALAADAARWRMQAEQVAAPVSVTVNQTTQVMATAQADAAVARGLTREDLYKMLGMEPPTGA